MHLINVNAQKRRFVKMLQHSTMTFTKPEQGERTKVDIFGIVYKILDQCERTKTDVFHFFFIEKQSNING